MLLRVAAAEAGGGGGGKIKSGALIRAVPVKSGPPIARFNNALLGFVYSSASSPTCASLHRARPRVHLRPQREPPQLTEYKTQTLLQQFTA